MITGDNRDTAEHIARDCGIVGSPTDIVMASEELAAIDDRELERILPRLAVLSRALPTDKSRLVRVAQDKGLVVGMTGDGINDAPALKRADIGFAMGSGTGVAREAGDIIILDNNLSSIGKAVLYGRTIFKSIRKFITLQLTMNFCAVGISMIGPFIGYDSPVTVVQMLWINIIMDTLGGLAFAGEAALPSYMKEKPKRRDEPILNGYMIFQMIWSALFTVGLYVAFLCSPSILRHFRSSNDDIYILTAFFALFIFTSVFHCFNCRTDRLNVCAGLYKNRAFIVIISLVMIIQLAFVYLGGALLRTAPLLRGELLLTLALALSVIPAELLRKLILRFLNIKQRF
jgi:calcium-translocating P-type ATPase